MRPSNRWSKTFSLVITMRVTWSISQALRENRKLAHCTFTPPYSLRSPAYRGAYRHHKPGLSTPCWTSSRPRPGGAGRLALVGARGNAQLAGRHPSRGPLACKHPWVGSGLQQHRNYLTPTGNTVINGVFQGSAVKHNCSQIFTANE